MFVSVRSRVVSCTRVLVSKRFAGGGGRPGAKPTFNWKERRELGLPEPRHHLAKLPVRGTYDDIEEMADEETFIDVLAQEDGFSFGGDTLPNDKKVIEPSMLFGPSKAQSRGKILKKRNYKGARFSHSRIFGKKGELDA